MEATTVVTGEGATDSATTATSLVTTGETTGTSTGASPTSAPTSPSSETASDGSSSDDTGDLVCDPNQVADTLSFTYVKQFETGIPDFVLASSYYNSDDDEVMVISYLGQARRFSVDGVPLGDVITVPKDMLMLDGATYDPVGKVGLLIDQSCVLYEVDPKTLAIQKSQLLGFGMKVCAGLAIGGDSSLYIASYQTDEMVVLSRDGLILISRVNVLESAGLDGIDGLAFIAGSENLLVMGSSPTNQAAILTVGGEVVVPTALLGQGDPPMIGGMPTLPDAVLTICGNGHAWICDDTNAICFDYAPSDGDKNACACLIPQ